MIRNLQCKKFSNFSREITIPGISEMQVSCVEGSLEWPKCYGRKKTGVQSGAA